MKKKMILSILIKISLLCFAFFMLSPSLQVKAMFSDTTNINIGIKLELGNVNVDTEKTTLFKDLSFTEGEAVEIMSSTLVNKGSLSAKLAYKIDVTKEDGSILTTDELKNMVISIDLGSVANKIEATATSLNSHSFTFVKNTSGSDVVIEPNSVGKVPVNVSYKSSTPTIKEKLKIKVTFRLIQSNATDANANMFSDEVTLENTILLVPKVIEEESYWPSENTFVKMKDGKLSYSLEKMNMVFSEAYDEANPSVKQIRNLNKAYIYIQIPKEENLKTTDKKTGKLIDTFQVNSVENSSQGKIIIGKTEIDEKNHRIKIPFNLMDSYDSSDSNKLNEYKYQYRIGLAIIVNKYNGESYDRYSGIYYNVEYFATRLALSSDIPSDIYENKFAFDHREIALSTVKSSITIKRLEVYNQWVNKNNFKDVKWNEETFDLEVKGGKTGQIESYLNPNKVVDLWLKSTETLSNAILNIKITGDTGNTLVISRKLEMQKGISMLKKSSLIEEQLVEDAVTQSSIEESEKDSTTEVENSTIVVEDPEKELMEDPVIESQEVDEVVDPSSSDTTIEINENIPEVIKEDKDVIEENE